MHTCPAHKCNEGASRLRLWETVPHKLSGNPGDDANATADLLAAAELYYQDQLSQHEIGERLGVSRSTVSRMLQLAREQGIVQIEIRRPSAASDLARELESALGVRRAVVVPTPPRGGLQALVAPAVAEIERLDLQPGDAFAVSWGATVWEIAQTRRFPPLRGVRLVPAIAGFDESDVRFQTNEIARRIADAQRRRRELPAHAGAAVGGAPALAAPRRRDGSPARAVGRPRGRTGRHRSARAGDSAPSRAPPGRPGRPRRCRGRRRLPLLRCRRPTGSLRARGAPARAVARPAPRRRHRRRVAAGATKTRSIVGAARAGLIDVLVTDTATAAGALEHLNGS